MIIIPDLYIRYVYDLAVPTDTPEAELEAFKPKPLDGEVEFFEVCLVLLLVLEEDY